MTENRKLPQRDLRVSQTEMHKAITSFIVLNTKQRHEEIKMISLMYYFEGYAGPSGLIVSL